MPNVQLVFRLLQCKHGLNNVKTCKPRYPSLISINTLPAKRHFWIGTVAPLTKEPNRSKLPRQSNLPHFLVHWKRQNIKKQNGYVETFSSRFKP